MDDSLRDDGARVLRKESTMSRNMLMALGALAAAIAVGGCQKMGARQEREVAFREEGVLLDPAIRTRGSNWEPSVVEYASGDVIAGPTLFPYEPDDTRAEWQQAAVAPLLFVGQTVAAPVTAFLAPVWGTVRYEGVQTPPTQSAIPPMAPTDEATFQALVMQYEQAVQRQQSLNEDLIIHRSTRQVDQTAEEVIRPLPGETPAPRQQPASAERSAPPAEPPAPSVTPAPSPAPQAAPTTRPAPAAVQTSPPPTTRPVELNK